MKSRWIIALSIAAALVLLLGGLGWQAGYWKRLFQNEQIKNDTLVTESELGKELNEDLGSYYQDSINRRSRADQIVDDVVREGRPDGSEADSLIDRARRSDAAFRRGVVELCPDCATGGLGDSDQSNASRVPKGEAERNR